MDKNCLAIITARGGSKRIPRKNIKSFNGKPIIHYSIEASLGANCFSKVMVSTDDEEIATISKEAGAEVPFFRSEKNADDYSTTADVIIEVIEAYKKTGKTFKYACCIYPTAPFISSEKLDSAYKLIIKKQAKSVVPVVRFGFPILRSFKMEDGLVSMNWPEHMMTRSQDLNPAFHDAGQFYFLDVDYFLEHKKLYTDKTVGIEMAESEVQDIDTLEDWKLAEIKYKLMQENNLV